MAKRIEAKSNWTNLLTTAAAAHGGTATAADVQVLAKSSWEDRAFTLCKGRQLDVALLDSLREECEGKTPEQVKARLFPIVVAAYGATVKVSESKANKGQKVIDRKAENGEAAHSQLVRIVRELTGGNADKEEIEIPAELLAAAVKLAKLANEYEGARSLAAKALAQAFAK